MCSQAPSTLLTPRERGIYRALSLVARRNLVQAAEEVRSRLAWDAERMQRFRLERCRRVLTAAHDQVPYYRELFQRCGFEPRSLTDLDQVRLLPVLTRDHLRECFDRLQNESIPRSQLVAQSTGGTSGVPVTVLQEKRHAMERMLVTHRMYWNMGRKLGDPTLLLAGSPIDAQAWTAFSAAMKNRLFGIRVRSAFNLTAGTLRRLTAELQRRSFDFVIGYVSAFDILASYLEENGERLRLGNIVPCAELVTSVQRQRWQATLGAVIFEIYGSREMNSIAAETRGHDHMLVNQDLYHLEITDETGAPLPPGVPGLITITSLLECGMPLIRYQLGDIGALLAGHPDTAPRLRVTHGRILGVIRSASGKMLPGEFFPHLMKEVADQVRQFQVVQEALDHLTVRLVRTDRFRASTPDYLREKIVGQLGPGMKINFEYPEVIAYSASGKWQPTISRIGPAPALQAKNSHSQSS